MLKKQQAKKTIKKVVKGLTKASKTHAGQAKTLSKIKLSKGGSTVNAAGNPEPNHIRSEYLLQQEINQGN